MTALGQTHYITWERAIQIITTSYPQFAPTSESANSLLRSLDCIGYGSYDDDKTVNEHLLWTQLQDMFMEQEYDIPQNFSILWADSGMPDNHA